LVPDVTTPKVTDDPIKHHIVEPHDLADSRKPGIENDAESKWQVTQGDLKSIVPTRESHSSPRFENTQRFGQWAAERTCEPGQGSSIFSRTAGRAVRRDAPVLDFGRL